MPQIYDMGPTALLPLRRKASWGNFRPKNPTASAGFEPVNLDTKGQHATPRPPKPFLVFILKKKRKNRNIYWHCVSNCGIVMKWFVRPTHSATNNRSHNKQLILTYLLQCWKPYAVVYGLALLKMGTVVPETCWVIRLSINHNCCIKLV